MPELGKIDEVILESSTFLKMLDVFHLHLK